MSSSYVSVEAPKHDEPVVLEEIVSGNSGLTVAISAQTEVRNVKNGINRPQQTTQLHYHIQSQTFTRNLKNGSFRLCSRAVSICCLRSYSQVKKVTSS